MLSFCLYTYKKNLIPVIRVNYISYVVKLLLIALGSKNNLNCQVEINSVFEILERKHNVKVIFHVYDFLPIKMMYFGL